MIETEEKKQLAERTWMIEGREKLGMDRQEFGDYCGCSEMLIGWLEEGNTITHPLIAAVIVRVIGGTVEQYNQLVHPDRKAKTVPKVKMPKPRATWKRPRACQQCSREFKPQYKEQRFCGLRCAGMHNQNIRRNRETEERKREMAK